LLVPQNTYIWFRVGGRYELSEEEVRQALKYRRFPNFPLTRAASLLFYASREKAGPVPSAESVFFSGPASHFSSVDDC
jgi:hypothetical protein